MKRCNCIKLTQLFKFPDLQTQGVRADGLGSVHARGRDRCPTVQPSKAPRLCWKGLSHFGSADGVQHGDSACFSLVNAVIYYLLL